MKSGGKQEALPAVKNKGPSRASRYDNTPHGVMVQLLYGTLSTTEWSAMMQFMITHGQTIRAVLVVQEGDGGPTALQRNELKETLTHLRPNLSVALLSDSRASRAVMTAILWITGQHEVTAAFAMRDIGKALEFLKLDSQEEAAARALLAQLRA